MCLDINAGCTAFTHGLISASSLINSLPTQGKSLIFVGDSLTHHINPTDKSTAPLFGDAISVIALEKAENSTLIYNSKSYGEKFHHLYIDKNDILKMNGLNVFNFAINEIPALIKETLKRGEISPDTIDAYALHGGNQLMLQSIIKKTHIDPNKIISSLHNYGNTSGASIPLSLNSHFINKKQNQTSGRFLFCGFGIGMSASCIIIDIKNMLLSEIAEI